MEHTKPILHPVAANSALLHVSKGNNREPSLVVAGLLGGLRVGVRWVESLGVDLARELAVCEHRRREGGIGPVRARLGEDGRVEEVVVAEVGVGAAGLHCQYEIQTEIKRQRGRWGVPETGVVFEEVVDVHLVTGLLV